MTPAQLQAKLNELLALPQESEWVEFKHNNTDPQMIGEYFSALSNAAALHRQPHGYVVWGIEDSTHTVMVIALDKVQKGKPIGEEQFSSLKGQKLIEGRRPNICVSAAVAAATETVVDYLKKRGIDKAYCQKMVVELFEKQGQASRQDIDKLLLAKLSDALDDDQKRNFIMNLLQELRRNRVVEVHGKGPGGDLGVA